MNEKGEEKKKIYGAFQRTRKYQPKLINDAELLGKSGYNTQVS
jgi:hypothetical protein